MKVATAAMAATLLATMVPAQADATTIGRQMWNQGGAVCQLSKPTIDTMVRPRATGMRNEGTADSFVICQYAATSAVFTSAKMYVTSIDGADHSVSCTGVTGGGTSGVYSTKEVNTGTSGTRTITWVPSDFDASDDFSNYMFSVTCTLPGGVSLPYVYATYSEDVGA
jgi:hypothetical protein